MRYSTKIKPEITLGFYFAYNCHSEAEVLIIFRNESVVGYMNTSVNFFLNGYTVAVIVGNTIGKVHEIVKFVVVNFLCYDIFAVFSENGKYLIKCAMTADCLYKLAQELAALRISFSSSP